MPGRMSTEETAARCLPGRRETEDYSARDSRFTGKINWVQLDLGRDDQDHFIDPEERLRIALSRQ
jgi:hypothetical protein